MQRVAFLYTILWFQVTEILVPVLYDKLQFRMDTMARLVRECYISIIVEIAIWRNLITKAVADWDA